MTALYRATFLLAVVLATTMALVPHPPHLPIDSLGDKFAHSLAFATMAVFAALAFPREPLARIGERLSFLGALIEVLQAIPSLHRDCDILDWIADTIAIAVTLCVVALLRRRRAGQTGR